MVRRERNQPDESHPPRGEEADLPDVHAEGKTEIGELKLLGLELGEVLRREGVGDLVVEDAVRTRDEAADGGDAQHGGQVPQGEARVEDVHAN